MYKGTPSSQSIISDKRKKARDYLSQKHRTDKVPSYMCLDELKEEEEMNAGRVGLIQVDSKLIMPAQMQEAIEKDPTLDSAPTEIFISILQVEARVFEISLSFETESKKVKKFNRLLGLLTHEMRSPLVAISSFIKVFKSLLERCATVKEAIELSNKYLDRSIYQIDCQLDACQLILDFTKNGSNSRLKIIEFNLRRMVQETCRMFADMNRAKKDVVISYQYDDKASDFIKSVTVMIMQVVLNVFL